MSCCARIQFPSLGQDRRNCDYASLLAAVHPIDKSHFLCTTADLHNILIVRKLRRRPSSVWSTIARQVLTDILSLPLCETSHFWTACWVLGASSILLPSERCSLAISDIFEGIGTLTKSASVCSHIGSPVSERLPCRTGLACPPSAKSKSTSPGGWEGRTNTSARAYRHSATAERTYRVDVCRGFLDAVWTASRICGRLAGTAQALAWLRATSTGYPVADLGPMLHVRGHSRLMLWDVDYGMIQRPTSRAHQ